MSDTSSIKKYPLSTNEVAKMLGIKPSGVDLSSSSVNHGEKLPVANLPTVDSHEPKDEHGHAEEMHGHKEESHEETQAEQDPAYVKLAKTILPYVIVFSIALFLYYFFFNGINFNFNPTPSTSNSKQSELEKLESQNLSAYQNWIKGFYYEVSDAKLLDPEADNSGNGLSNFQKYLLNLNPKAYDTLGLGMSDSEAVAKGINPSTGKALTAEQKDIVEKYIDPEVVNNRLTLYRLHHPQTVAGVNTETSAGSTFSTREFVPSISSQNIPSTPAPTAQDQIYSNLEIDTSKPGQINIPDLNINAPIMWSASEKDFQKDLQSGVIHYPGTAMPGQIGTTYIAGHSSNFAWAKGSYNQIFEKLGNLNINTSFTITVVQKNGKSAVLHYVVAKKQEFSPTDPKQFENSGKSVVALSTCWPIGSTAKRLVAFGELTQVEK